MNKRARVIAMYLPQFHPIPENDEVWGKGFTEWTNVGRAKPLFRGHYQPRVPADLGYYDLRMPEVREAQARMASEAGVEGFMYWHYWFGNGRMALERPFEEVLKSGNPDFPFCLGWANHSWRNDHWQNATTTQSKQSVFIFEQQYPGKSDIISHFEYLLPAFKDNRYITVDNKPLFLIWDPVSIPNISEFVNIWNDLAITHGLKGIHFVGMAAGSPKRQNKVFDLGLDSVAPCNMWNAECTIDGKYWRMLIKHISKTFPRLAPLDKYKYESIIPYLVGEREKNENVYPFIIPNWDRSPRSGRRAVIYTGSTPELFKKHVDNVLNYVSEKQPDHRIIFLRSWNEWAEGNYMEPDLRFGHGYLDALRDSIVIK